VDVSIHPESRFLRISPGLEVGRRDEPYIAPLVALPDALQLEQIWVLLDILFEQSGQVIVAVETVELDLGHDVSFPQKKMLKRANIELPGLSVSVMKP
jgi:hypothetical protein